MENAFPLFTEFLVYLYTGTFFFIAGYFTQASLESKGPMRYLKHRFLSIYPPFALFTVLNYVIGLRNSFDNVFIDLIGLFDIYGPFEAKAYNFWFVPCLLIFSLFFALIYKRGQWFMVLTSLVVSVGSILLGSYGYPFFTPNFSVYLLVFCAGYLANLGQSKPIFILGGIILGGLFFHDVNGLFTRFFDTTICALASSLIFIY